MTPCQWYLFGSTRSRTLDEQGTLFTVAEMAIGMAGFSAIVVMFKRRGSGRWDPADADRFNGMLLHSIAAGFFCILPSVLQTFTREVATTWLLGSAALGLQVLVHTCIVLRLPSSSWRVKALVGILGLLVAALQLANVTRLGFDREFGPYLVGVLWHMFQAGLLFLMLIWVRASDVGGGEGE